jgi:hypothetical protein
MTSKVLWKGTLLADGKVVDAADLHASQRQFVRTDEYPIFAVHCQGNRNGRNETSQTDDANIPDSIQRRMKLLLPSAEVVSFVASAFN